jgi:hypothetical protein
MATEGKTSTSALPSPELKQAGTLEITDSRTKTGYSLPITQGGRSRPRPRNSG